MNIFALDLYATILLTNLLYLSFVQQFHCTHPLYKNLIKNMLHSLLCNNFIEYFIALILCAAILLYYFALPLCNTILLYVFCAKVLVKFFLLCSFVHQFWVNIFFIVFIPYATILFIEYFCTLFLHNNFIVLLLCATILSTFFFALFL